MRKLIERMETMAEARTFRNFVFKDRSGVLEFQKFLKSLGYKKGELGRGDFRQTAKMIVEVNWNKIPVVDYGTLFDKAVELGATAINQEVVGQYPAKLVWKK
jgi:hypothetical protein